MLWCSTHQFPHGFNKSSAKLHLIVRQPYAESSTKFDTMLKKKKMLCSGKVLQGCAAATRISIETVWMPSLARLIADNPTLHRTKNRTAALTACPSLPQPYYAGLALLDFQRSARDESDTTPSMDQLSAILLTSPDEDTSEERLSKRQKRCVEEQHERLNGNTHSINLPKSEKCASKLSFGNSSTLCRLKPRMRGLNSGFVQRELTVSQRRRIYVLVQWAKLLSCAQCAFILRLHSCATCLANLFCPEADR
jgi:hypothetical protein